MESSTPVFDTSATGDEATSPLLALPLELRIKIYEELLYPDPSPDRLLYMENGDRVGKEYELSGDQDENAERYEDVVHLENAEGEDEEDAEASEQHEVEVVNKDNHGDNDRGATDHGDNDYGEVSTDATGLHGEVQPSGEATTRIKIGDYECIDYGSTPPDHDYGWLQHICSFGIDPTILCVNKQIHYEGVSYLYKNVSCDIHLDEDLTWWSANRQFLMQDYRRIYALDEDGPTQCIISVPLCTRYYNSYFKNKSDLKLHCLRWVPDINIGMSWDDLLKRPVCCCFWSKDKQHNRHELRLTPAGECILEILRYVNQNPAPGSSTTRRLHMTFNGDPWDICAEHFETYSLLTGWQRSKLMDTRKEEGISQIIALLRSLTKTRTVTVEEGFWTYDGTGSEKRYSKREVDLDTLAWIET